MSEFENAPGRPLLYFLVKQHDRVTIEAIPEDEVDKRRQSGVEFVGEGHDTQEMADAALDDYLGDQRAV